MNDLIRKNSMQFGFILAILLTFPMLLGYVIDTDFIVSYWIAIVQFLGIIVTGVICVIYSRRILQGFISFKEAFSSYFTMVVIGTGIGALFSILLLNIIDSDFKTELMNAQEMAIRKQLAWVQEKSKDLPQENLAEIENKFDKMIEVYRESEPYAFISILKSWVFQVAFYAFLGLIISLILKKDPLQNTPQVD